MAPNPAEFPVSSLLNRERRVRPGLSPPLGGPLVAELERGGVLAKEGLELPEAAPRKRDVVREIFRTGVFHERAPVSFIAQVFDVIRFERALPDHRQLGSYVSADRNEVNVTARASSEAGFGEALALREDGCADECSRDQTRCSALELFLGLLSLVPSFHHQAVGDVV
jgi:hypothetical protein